MHSGIMNACPTSSALLRRGPLSIRAASGLVRALERAALTSEPQVRRHPVPATKTQSVFPAVVRRRELEDASKDRKNKRIAPRPAARRPILDHHPTLTTELSGPGRRPGLYRKTRRLRQDKNSDSKDKQIKCIITRGPKARGKPHVRAAARLDRGPRKAAAPSSKRGARLRKAAQPSPGKSSRSTRKMQREGEHSRLKKSRPARTGTCSARSDL